MMCVSDSQLCESTNFLNAPRILQMRDTCLFAANNVTCDMLLVTCSDDGWRYR